MVHLKTKPSTEGGEQLATNNNAQIVILMMRIVLLQSRTMIITTGKSQDYLQDDHENGSRVKGLQAPNLENQKPKANP